MFTQYVQTFVIAAGISAVTGNKYELKLTRQRISKLLEYRNENISIIRVSILSTKPFKSYDVMNCDGFALG
jgi:hypothetical protein